ncbi:unnamed protein product [Fructobacillus fructosus]|jgi:hypothetical protein|uniref:hypothetical protein n=1 Tax=Fructobacillus fructosus TaxID=1631 RepID=UPI002DA2BA0A|nr:unnamed protein product [Fructobacillus fructosus]
MKNQTIIVANDFAAALVAKSNETDIEKLLEIYVNGIEAAMNYNKSLNTGSKLDSETLAKILGRRY